MSRTWLVVDDEVADTFILRRAIKEAGLPVQVKFFPDGASLIAHLDSEPDSPADLVLVDINMPDIDGFELLETLKAHAASARLPLVMYSNTKDERDSLRSSERGAAAFVSKPSSFFEARAIVRILDDLANVRK